MLRFITVVLFVILYLVLGIPVLLVEMLIRRRDRTTGDYAALRTVQWAFRIIAKLSGTKVTVIGEERIPDEPVLYVANHRSYFDIVLTYARCKRLTGYMAKKEMLRYPLLRDWMKALYCLFLDRENIREGLKTILQAVDYVKMGVSIFIFPEGTRNKGEELSMLPFRGGALKIAEKSGCAIVPVSLNNTSNIFEAHFPKIRKTHVVIEYGEPIYPKELDKEKRKRLDTAVCNTIQETIRRNASLV